LPVGAGIMNFRGDLYQLNHKGKSLFQENLSLDFELLIPDENDPIFNLTAFMEKEDQKIFFQEMLRFSSGEISLDAIFHLVKSQTLNKMPLRIIANPPDETADADTFIVILMSAENERIVHQHFSNTQKIESISKMVDRIAHEINNPLMIIQGCSDIVKKSFDRNTLDPQKLEKYNHRLNSNITRMSHIISSLKSFSNDDNQDSYQISSIQFLADEALQICRSEFDLSGIEIKVMFPENEIQIYAKRSELIDALYNLIKNAIQAIEQSPEKWIKIEASQQQEKAFITFTDAGLGISENVVERILEPFFTTRPVGGGLGLGLTYSQGVITRHKGKIFYNSMAKNTQFIIEIPLAKYVEKDFKNAG
jgi:signal transduction histidine kinase